MDQYLEEIERLRLERVERSPAEPASPKTAISKAHTTSASTYDPTPSDSRRMAEWRRRVELAFLGAVRRSRLPRLHFDESAFTPAFWQSPTGEAVLANRSEAQVAVFRSGMEFFFDLREAYGDNAPEREASVLRRYCEPDILVLDDMQDRGETQWEQRTLALLIDKRYRDRKDTILIANIDPAKFEAHIGAAISDRIRECGGVIECDWESFRGTK